jgi:hypothetical protein
MNLLLLVPDGVGIRNFILTPFLDYANESGTCQVLHSIPNEWLSIYEAKAKNKVKWEPLINYHDTPASIFLRYFLSYAHLNWGNTEAMRNSRTSPIRGSWKMQTIHRSTRLLGRFAGSTAWIQRLDRWHCLTVARLPEVEHYRHLLRRFNPSVVFCSHQRPSIVLPIVLAARSLGIPTATFIFSWDNMTSKGRIAAPFEHFLVWSKLMHDELLRFYPDVSPERVHIVGTPQFDPYADPRLLWSREEFFARVGADPARPLLCYSGGDKGVALEDQEHVRILLELIRSGKIKGNPQVMLRPMPVDEGSRFEQVRKDFPELIYARPAWIHTQPNDWTRVIPTQEDVQFLANLTQHADININLASTMTLDFAIHDRPVVNVAFDVADPPAYGRPLWDYYYRYEHYRPVIEFGAARFARSAEELATHINAYLEDSSLDREARRRLVQLQVGAPLGESSQRIVDVLKKIEKKS